MPKYKHGAGTIYQRTKIGPDGKKQVLSISDLTARSKRRIDRTWLDETLPPRKAAEMMGMVERTFYKLLENGVVPAKKQGGKWHLQPGWEETARQWQEKEEADRQRAKFNKTCARAWAIKRKIPLNSAKTQIKRWRSKELGEEEIKEKIGRQSRNHV